MTATTHFKAPRERKKGPPPVFRERERFNGAPGHVRRQLATTFELAILIATCDCCGKLCCRRTDDRADG